MRYFVGNPIIKQELEMFEEIRDYAIAFCTFIDSGGGSCDYTNNLINKCIDEVMKLKASRDRVYKYLGYEIPAYDEEGIRI